MSRRAVQTAPPATRTPRSGAAPHRPQPLCRVAGQGSDAPAELPSRRGTGTSSKPSEVRNVNHSPFPGQLPVRGCQCAISRVSQSVASAGMKKSPRRASKGYALMEPLLCFAVPRVSGELTPSPRFLAGCADCSTLPSWAKNVRPVVTLRNSHCTTVCPSRHARL